MSDVQIFVEGDSDVLVEADVDAGLQVEVTPSVIEVAPEPDAVDIQVDADTGDVTVDIAPATDVVIEAPPAPGVAVDVYTGQTGPQGPQGPQGPAGESGLGSYVHIQAVPAQDWTINHDLGAFPNVAFVDSSGRQVEGEVRYVDQNTVTGSFASAFAGTAYLS